MPDLSPADLVEGRRLLAAVEADTTDLLTVHFLEYNDWLHRHDKALFDAAAERCWQPIATAPKSGPCHDILLYVPGLHGTKGVVVGHWAFGGGDEQPAFGPGWFYWTGYHFDELRQKPTHWMSLPEPPGNPGNREKSCSDSERSVP